MSDRANKITSFLKWEQAFRIYATIYTGANPSRAKEIWQYVSVISTAASSLVWENVYSYDVTFRHLMAFNPQRSWAVTYTQMWNLAMHEPLNTRYNNMGYKNQSPAGLKQQKQYGRRKSDYCWSFNKGQKCKFGKKCRFIERCSYCDSGAHGQNVCPKLGNKPDKRNEGGNKE